MIEWQMNDKLGGILKEAVVWQGMYVLFWHLPVGSEENAKIYRDNRRLYIDSIELITSLM
jgi:hypothetical protein